jgi:hypothetical protein
MALGSTQPLTEMSTRNFLGDKSDRRVGLTTLPPSMSRMSENVGASISHTFMGLRGLLQSNLYLYNVLSFVNVTSTLDATFPTRYSPPLGGQSRVDTYNWRSCSLYISQRRRRVSHSRTSSASLPAYENTPFPRGAHLLWQRRTCKY